MGLLGGLYSVSRDVFRASCTTAAITGNSIYSAIQNARTNKEIRTIYNNVAEANYVNRAVTVVPGINKQQLLLAGTDSSENDVYDLEYTGTTPALDFIWGSTPQPECTIVSGGDNSNRVIALVPFIHKSQQEGIPVVVLHTGNSCLEKEIINHSIDSEFISLNGKYCDLFRGMTVDDIAYLLYETIPKDMAKPAAEALLRSLIDVLLHKKGDLTINDLADFPIINLKDEIDALFNDEIITKSEYNEIDRYFMAGSSEMDTVRVFLNKLNRQFDSICGRANGNNSNIKKMINSKGVVAIDVGKVNNELYVEMLINYLTMLQTAGKDFTVLIDGVQLSKYPQISNLIRGRTYAICQQDFLASLKGGSITGDELFDAFMGDIKVAVLFRHASGESRKKWSEYMGSYKKIRIRYNISQNSSFIVSSDTRGISVDETDEPRIRPETLEKLTEALACMYCSDGILIGEIKE